METKKIKLPLARLCLPCPGPFSTKLNAASPFVYNPDFNFRRLASELGINPADIRTTKRLNETRNNLWYCHTFVWKPLHKCCQVTKAVLTVKMKALVEGRSANDGLAGNDRIAIMHLGSPVLPYNERVYDFTPFYEGQTSTKIWNLTGAALNNININKRLSLLVQDDTAVISATLELDGCCLKIK